MKKKLRVYLFFIFYLVFAFPFSGRAETSYDVTNGNVEITEAGDYKITGTTSSNMVVVNASGQEVNITINGLNIDINETNEVCAFNIQAGTVNLTLEGKNVLKSGGSCAGLQVPKGSKLTIKGDGELDAFGAWNSAGIGGIFRENAGTIIITEGTVTATGGAYGAGIGGGCEGSGGTITITGGTVTATGGDEGAGIGGGSYRSGGTIIVTGGTVTATGGNGGAGIGKGKESSDSGTFSTKNGNAFIIASNISDNSEEKKKDWQGVIFEGNEGHIYGKPTIKTNAEIPADKKLIINEGQELVFAEGVTLTNNGVIEGSENIKLAVTYHSNDENSSSFKDNNAKYESAPSYTNFTRKYYSIEGWYDKESEGQKVEKITGSIDLYANWIKNEIKLVEPLPALEGTYEKEIEEYDLSQLFSEDSYKDKISYTLAGENYGLSISESQITGTPNKVAAKSSTITITISSTDCENSIEANIPIHIKGKSSIDGFDEILNSIYSGNAVDITSPDIKDENGNKIENAIVDLSYQIKIGNSQYELTTADNSGASDEGEAPKYAGEYKVIASFAGNDNYAAAEVNQTAEFIIKKAALTVTPLSDQIVLPNETKDFKPKYEVTGAVNNEEPLFNGDLKLDDDGKTIVNNDLTLKEPFDRNYSVIIKEGVTITLLDNTVANDMIVLSGTTKDNAYIDQVTITAPDGFLIKLVSSTQTKAANDYNSSFTWSQIGTFDISYKLKRMDGIQESDPYTITVTVKKKTEEPEEPVNPPVEPEKPIEPTVYHTVTLPSVDGATTDPAAGNHKVEAWGSFRFRLTLDKDYDLSKPVVTTDYGAVIASQGEDGVYVINFVNRSFEIRIDGVVKNPDPVANAEIQSGIKVWTNNHQLFIRTDKPEEVSVYTFSGQLQKKFRSEVGDRFISLPSGTYIVLIGDERFKVIL